MFATKARTDVSAHPDQAAITATSSLAAVQTLIKIGFGCITFIRGILSDDNFDDQTLNGSKNEGMLSTSSSGTSGSQISSGSTKVKMVKRKFSTEADTLLDYLEIGIFDALEKQYLKSFVFAIYLDEKDPKNLIEAYTFNFSYHNLEGTDEIVPVMSIESSLSKLGLMDGADPVGKASSSGKVPTLGDVKKSARSLVKRLIGICQSMEPLPDRRFATFKIYYHENTPPEYEPPHFVAGDAEKDRFFFATHNVNEVPERCSVGGIKTGKHSVDIQIASICSLLPSPDDNLAPFHGHAHNRNTPRPDYNTRDAKRKADAGAQVADAERRQVVWDADPLEEDAEEDADPEFEGGVGEVPVGVRRDGEIVPIPIVVKDKGKGKEMDQETIVRHGGGRHHVPELNDPEALQNAELEGATQIIETQATVIIPSGGAAVSTQDHQRAIETHMDVDRGIDTLELRQMLDDEQDVTMEDSQIPGGSLANLTQATEHRSQTPRARNANVQEAAREKDEVAQLPSTPVPAAIDPAIIDSKNVDCDCNVEGVEHDTFVCQGDCGRRLHAWCMGFHTAKDAGYSPYSQCLGCELRSMDWFDLLEEKEKHKLSQNLAELALYRRTLKKVYAEGLPGNPHALQRLVGCTRQDAMHNLNRMEAEEFIQTKTTQTDELGFLTSETITKTTKAGKKKKPNKRNCVKPQPVLVQNRAALKALERYFDPRGELEKELVDSYRSKCEARKRKGKGKGKKTPAVNVLVPSSSVNLPSQQEESAPIVERISRTGAPSPSLPPQDMESQTQQETQMLLDTQLEVSNLAPPSPPATRQAPKRKSSARIANSQAKKLKISLANFGVDLENFD
ncbi:HORMA-domain-containing protein [Ceratobasidium sp. AG-I]|nr:HORMA-domain-containing protein [Ceratobasidium sp. AG-I]